MIKQQLKNLTLDKIKTIIKKINKLELLVKKNSNFSNKITNNFVLEMLDLPNNSL